jgi:hypothetical protein
MKLSCTHRIAINYPLRPSYLSLINLNCRHTCREVKICALMSMSVYTHTVESVMNWSHYEGQSQEITCCIILLIRYKNEYADHR